MKYNRFTLGLLATLLFLTMSCQKETPDLLTGKWEWIKTINAFSGQESNPQIVGFSQTLVFSDNSIMQEYKDSVLINTTNYTIVINPTNPTNHELTTNTILNSHFFIECDTLIFSEAYVDGDAIYYVKIK